MEPQEEISDIISHIFVPARFGYKPYTDLVTGRGSFNDINRSLGYNPDRAYVYSGDWDENFAVQNVSLEIFTKNVIFVYAHESVTSLKKSKVDYFLRNYTVKGTYDSYTVDDILTTGIANQTLDIDFLGRVLNLRQPALTGIFYSERLGLNLFFENGLLTDFSTASGLEMWGRYVNEFAPGFISALERQARLYWDNDRSSIIKEVNIQAEALGGTPDAARNEYAHLHRSEHGVVNYRMLLVCHYNRSITIKEFELINHGRYKELPADNMSTRRLALGLFAYTFDAITGDLIRHDNYS